MPDTSTLQVASIAVTVALALLSYFVTYLNNIRIENRKAQLKFVSDQLQFLYGPLFSFQHASLEAWNAFRSRCRPRGAFFNPINPPTQPELIEWRLWMTAVFMPINLKMESAIVENAHLIEGTEMPVAFQKLLAHVEVYKVTLQRWQSGDYSVHTAYINFPEGFSEYVSQNYEKLKGRQASLM